MLDRDSIPMLEASSTSSGFVGIQTAVHGLAIELACRLLGGRSCPITELLGFLHA